MSPVLRQYSEPHSKTKPTSTETWFQEWFDEDIVSTTISPHDLVDTFEFPSLSSVKTALVKAKVGNIEGIMISLSELSEYEKDKSRAIKKRKSGSQG